MPRKQSTSGRSTQSLPDLPTIVETEEPPFIFGSFTAIARLEAVLENPDDIILLSRLTWRHATHKEPGLSPIWAFAMIKGGAIAPNWRAGEPWQLMMVEEYPDGFFPNKAYEHLHTSLPKRDDKDLLRTLRSKYEKDKEYVEPASWAIWKFAVTKGKESAREWRIHQNAARAREVMGETA